MSKSTSKPQTFLSPMRLHDGKALIRLADFYPRIVEVILEIIQNAIDMNALRIFVKVNQKTRSVIVTDDGDGTTKSHFEKALMSVASGIKSKDKFGRFGIGLISPLGKCSRFFFTSSPRGGSHGYLEWMFDAEQIAEQQIFTGIPAVERNDIQFSRAGGTPPKGVTFVPWRTEVRLENYTKDTQINRVAIESLSSKILDMFGTVMRRKKIVVSITITTEDGERKTAEVRAKDFDGTKLPEYIVENDVSGKSVFRLYLAKSKDKVRKGKVLFGELFNEFRIDFPTFVRSLPEACQLSEDVTNALRSGFFEGYILNSKIRLHPNRRSFVVNDSLLNLCTAIEKWYEEAGSSHFKEVQEQREDERYQDLGLRSMRVIEGMLKNPEFASMLKTIGSFKKGSIGGGHTEHPGQIDEDPSLSVKSGTVKTEKPDQGDSGGSTNEPNPDKEKKHHVPLTVKGPRGQRRTIVRNNSLGLNLIHEPMFGSDLLWVFDKVTGTIRINVLDTLWVKCSMHNDKTLMRFQEYIILQALVLEGSPEDWGRYARIVLDEMMGPYVFALINGDLLAGRQPGRKKKPEEVEKKSEKKRAS